MNTKSVQCISTT